MSPRKRPLRVLVVGAGKVGVTFAKGLRAKGHRVSSTALRRGLPTRPCDVDALLVATREADFSRVVAHFVAHPVLPRTAVALHVSGSRSADELHGLRAVLAGIGKLHPLVAFASIGHPPSLAGAHANVAGDAVAVAIARRLARDLGLVPRTFESLDPVAYHAAAGLVANGAAALVAAGQRVLVTAGVPIEDTPALLGPLLRSVAENVTTLGMPAALTGPVRRGDVQGLAGHRATLARLAPELADLYAALVRAQIPAARALGDAPEADLGAIAEAFRT